MIEIQGVTKRFETVTALQSVDLNVAEGEVAKQLTVCNSVEDAVAALDAFYGDEHV